MQTTELIKKAAAEILAKVPQGYGMTQDEAEIYATAALSSAEGKAVEVKKLTKTQIETLANNIHNVNEYAYTVECLTYHMGGVALVDVPAVESEPDGWLCSAPPGVWSSGRIDTNNANVQAWRDKGYTCIPYWLSPSAAHSPRSSLQSAEGEIAKLTRPIVGIEHRKALEVFDIMADRIRLALSTPPSPYGGDNGGGSATDTSGGGE